jgi:hypothetical protein
MPRVMPADDNAKEEQEEEFEKSVRLFLEEEQAKEDNPLPHKMGAASAVFLSADPSCTYSSHIVRQARRTTPINDAVINLSKQSYAIPPGARVRPCPLTAAPRSAPHVCKAFLDRHCLLDGRDWEAGFVLALAHSIVAVPLLPGARTTLVQWGNWSHCKEKRITGTTCCSSLCS